MKYRQTLIRATAITAGVMAGMMIFTSLSIAIAPTYDPVRPPSVESELPLTVEKMAEEIGVSPDELLVRTNSTGQTYGSLLTHWFNEGQMPDLVLVYMDDGREGYVYSAELAGRMAANPEEAIQITLEQQAQSEPTVLVARDTEGSPIGTFTLAN